MDEASVAHTLASRAEWRLMLFHSLFFFKFSYIKSIHDLTDLPDGCQVVANILTEQCIIEMICALYSHFVFGHEDWVDWVED